ncbi:hypothetical protein T265_13039, partial [Opisthorchis viverrini]
QNIRLTDTRGLHLPDNLQEGRDRSWTVEEFSATLLDDQTQSGPVCCFSNSFIEQRLCENNIRLTETRELRLPDEPQEGRNRSWAVDGFSATLWVVHYKYTDVLVFPALQY